MAIILTFQGFLYLSNAETVPELIITSAGDRKQPGNFSALQGVLGDEGLIWSETRDFGIRVYVCSQLGQCDWTIHHHKYTVNTDTHTDIYLCIYIYTYTHTCTNTCACSYTIHNTDFLSVLRLSRIHKHPLLTYKRPKLSHRWVLFPHCFQNWFSQSDLQLHIVQTCIFPVRLLYMEITPRNS